MSFKISVVANLNIQTVPNKKCQLIASKIRIAPDFIGWVKTLVQMKSWNLFKGIYDGYSKVPNISIGWNKSVGRKILEKIGNS